MVGKNIKVTGAYLVHYDFIEEFLRNERGFGEKRIKIVESIVLNALDHTLKDGGDYIIVKDIE